MDKEKILELFEANRLSEAAAMLDESSALGESWSFYMLGRIAWKEGRKADAISLYEHATALDPHSEAAVALEQAREIMNFYNKDLYNP